MAKANASISVPDGTPTVSGDYVAQKNAVLAVVVAYYPDEMAWTRVRALSSTVGEVFIVDNTPFNETKNVCVQAAGESQRNIVINNVGKNIGVAAALNLGIEEAKNKGFKYLLTLDQDSAPPEFAVSQLLTTLMSADDIGSVSPIFHDESNKRRSFTPVKRFVLTPKRIMPKTGIHEVYAAITSGTLYKLKALEIAGNFCEKYFIDCVDHEYCLRMWRSGLRVLVDSNVDMAHSLGKRKIVQKGIFRMAPTNYPAVRYYYMLRNRVFLYKKHGMRFPQFVLFDIIYALLVLCRVVITEQNKAQKLKLMGIGVLDGIRGRGGACIRA